MNKAEFLKQFVKEGVVYNFGSDEGSLHSDLKKVIPEIMSVDLYGNADVEQDFNKPLRFKGNIADTIIACEVIEHLNCPLEFLKQCKKVLKKGGRLIITTPNALSLEEYKAEYKHQGTSESSTQEYVGHIYNWKKSDFEGLIRLSGLKIMCVDYLDFHWKRNFVFITLAKIFPCLKPKLFAVLLK